VPPFPVPLPPPLAVKVDLSVVGMVVAVPPKVIGPPLPEPPLEPFALIVNV
jgi:hypothetical protein